MMKNIMFFLFLFMPVYVFAYKDGCMEHGKYEKLYTVDKRCYVTNEQKKIKPYSAVVALVNGDFIYCTGTVIKFNGKFYLYTAKHCTDNNGDNIADDTLQIKTQTGKKITVYRNNVGSYDIKNDEKLYGDWAVYSIKQTDLVAVETTTREKIDLYSYFARLIGYGALKIMSDDEINKFKSNYITYLKNLGGGFVTDEDIKKYPMLYGITKNGGIRKSNDLVKVFLDNMEHDYWLDLFANHELKYSMCRYWANGGIGDGCQAWSGNSGGGIFDIEDNLMAIITRATVEIGGLKHASAKQNSRSSPTSISLLKKVESK